ncbi:MAG: Hsp20/alpha crystallin family protein [Chryseolinea sp.]
MIHHAHFGYAARHGFQQRWQKASWRRPRFNVPMNIIEKEAFYEAHIYATGFNKEHIKIKVADNILHISGTRTVDEANLPDFVVQEFPIKNFDRVIHLRGKVEIAGISARQDDNVLIVTLPKNEAAQKETQEIQVS